MLTIKGADGLRSTILYADNKTNKPIEPSSANDKKTAGLKEEFSHKIRDVVIQGANPVNQAVLRPIADAGMANEVLSQTLAYMQSEPLAGVYALSEATRSNLINLLSE